METNKFKYDVVVSFAGEDRAMVEEFVAYLASKNISVFYDSWEQAQLWGKDLYQYLDMIYRQAAKYCVIFVSESYIKKAWTKHELRSSQARAFQQNTEYILPIKLDDTNLPGLPETIAYIDVRSTSLNKIAQILIEKLDESKATLIAKVTEKMKSSIVAERMEALSEIGVYRLNDLLELAVDTMINDPLSKVREKAASTIDNLRDERAILSLIRAIHDDEFSVRDAAGWGLVHLGDMVIPYMKEIVDSSDNFKARHMAQLVLAKFQPNDES